MMKEDYIGEDGLLYCGICGEAKQAYLPQNTFFGKNRRTRMCRCEREYHEKETKKKLEVVLCKDLVQVKMRFSPF